MGLPSAVRPHDHDVLLGLLAGGGGLGRVSNVAANGALCWVAAGLLSNCAVPGAVVFLWFRAAFLLTVPPSAIAWDSQEFLKF